MNASSPSNTRKIAFVGFGEAGQAFVEGWSESGLPDVQAYDIKTDSPNTAVRDGKRADYDKAGVRGHAALVDALAEADVVISVVTADQALVAADAAATAIRPGAFYLDCNSCSPGTKRQSSQLIEEAGGRYVDVAVVAPVRPKLHRAPLLISGPHAQDAMSFFDDMGMDATVTEGGIGAASSIKMIRSVMMKGMEALTLECILAGRLAGVEERVIASLEETFPTWGWGEQAPYNLERVMTHGIRRAAEMRAVTETIKDLGFSGGMAHATADWQQMVGDLRLTCEGDTLAERADQILNALGKKA